ncbi:hypothetical protein [Sediminitomix flava]|uniref:Uncharacterized protein n=1 Tax=Sediminitomix flava TaxID=379075 RepID=A0A315Z6I1_SEDFL|nr:hypothetical protein [Sediminitomix flava]PWJ39997.1 hypothetical protein BC781_10560 [Sediminitomix flava]
MKEKDTIWNKYKLYFIHFKFHCIAKALILSFLLNTQTLNFGYSQDNPAFEFHVSPLQLLNSPDLNGSRASNFGGALLYNISRNIAIGTNYHFIRLNDLYTIGTMVINENNTNDIILLDEFAGNLQLQNHFLNAVFRYQTFSIKRTQFYISFLAGILFHRPRLLDFPQNTYMMRKGYKDIITDASEGANLDIFDIDDPFNPEFIEPIRYLDNDEQIIFGLELGIILKVNRVVSFDLGISLNDVFKAVEYYNTRTIGMISEVEDNENFLQDASASYLGQSTTREKNLFLNFKIGLIFSFLDKKL